MKIITAANKRFLTIANDCIASIKAQGYEAIIYDLGGLGFGKPFEVKDEKFYTEGQYDTSHTRFKKVSRSLFKPSVVKDAMSDYPGEIIVWMDSDTLLMKPLELDWNYDIGVALRSKTERDKIHRMRVCGLEGAITYYGRHNSGFIVIQPTENAKTFVNAWEALTAKLGNDQLAMNVLIQDTQLNVKKFPYEYNSQEQNENTVVYHYKGSNKLVAV